MQEKERYMHIYTPKHIRLVHRFFCFHTPVHVAICLERVVFLAKFSKQYMATLDLALREPSGGECEVDIAKRRSDTYVRHALLCQGSSSHIVF